MYQGKERPVDPVDISFPFLCSQKVGRYAARLEG